MMPYGRLLPRDCLAFRNLLSRGLQTCSPFASKIAARYLHKMTVPGDPSDIYRKTAKMIEQATIILWRKELLCSAGKNCQIFRNTEIDQSDLLSDVELWIPDVDFDVPDHIREHLELEGKWVVAAWLFVFCLPYPMLTIIAVRQDEDERLALSVLKTKGATPLSNAGAFLPHLINVPLWIQDDDRATTIALLRFRSSTIASLQPFRPDRAERRRAAKIGRTIADALFVVTLRRDHRQTGADSHRVVEWQWQWIVRGHWRNQYFPSLKDHKPVFILPYLKGPEDRPLKVHDEPIFSIRR